MYAVLILCAIILPTNGKICHTVEVPMCKMPQAYNTSIDFSGQHDLAKDILHHFEHLITLNCSHFTRLFVCFPHLPLCTNDAEFSAVLPCHSVCLDVYFNCIHLYNRINLPWPQHLNCSKFSKSPSLCIKPSSTPTPASSNSLSSTAPTPTSWVVYAIIP